MNLRLLSAATLAAVVPFLLTACGGDDGKDADTKKAEKAVEDVVGDSDVELKGNSKLDAAGYALVSVQKEKYEDYEIDGDRVLLKVRDGVELAGSECIIVGAATETDYPDVTFVLVEADGTETAC